MRIVLVRHGRPGVVSRDSIAGRDIGRWVRHYNEAGISRELAPPAAVRDLASSVGCLLASSLRRARESAAWLAASKDVLADRLSALAAEYGSVMAIGHGMFNRFIATQLRRRGWCGPKMWSRTYWAAAEFE